MLHIELKNEDTFRAKIIKTKIEISKDKYINNRFYSNNIIFLIKTSRTIKYKKQLKI